MARIKQNVDALRDAILRERSNPTPGSTLINSVRVAAVKATLGGIKSEEWRVFMTIFADNEEQLKRLTAQDTFKDQTYVLESSAYLVGGAICTSETTAHLPHRIDPAIDDGLSDKADDSFEKLLQIPPPPQT